MDTINTRANIIAGPNQKDYWNHSQGVTAPLEREEGPFPIQGNIGSLLRLEEPNRVLCDSSQPDISGSPNCVGIFTPDMYTQVDTCGENCLLRGPEAWGDQSFGLTGSNPYTNAHGLHAYTNERAGAEGQDGSRGCYSFVPRISQTSNGPGGNPICVSDPLPQYESVPNWGKLTQFRNLTQ